MSPTDAFEITTVFWQDLLRRLAHPTNPPNHESLPTHTGSEVPSFSTRRPRSTTHVGWTRRVPNRGQVPDHLSSRRVDKLTPDLCHVRSRDLSRSLRWGFPRPTRTTRPPTRTRRKTWIEKEGRLPRNPSLTSGKSPSRQNDQGLTSTPEGESSFVGSKSV